jgi:hypothetical protein
MDFVEWWKKSSETASEAHYALRFDADELNEMQRGILTDSAKRKVEARLNSLTKRNQILWIGCGIPSLLIGLLILTTLGFFFFRALWYSSRSPIAWVLVIFFIFVVTVMLIGGVYVIALWQRRKMLTRLDLRGNKIGIQRGKVFINISRTENGFNISYVMNGTEYVLFDDAIGWEIHMHFFGSPNITGQTNRETEEDYIFYCLPESKRLLHWEKV